MIYLALGSILLFGCLGGLSGYIGVRGKNETLPFAGRLGLYGAAFRTSEEIWIRAHSAAAPIFLMASAVSLLHGLGIAILGVLDQPSMAPLLHALMGSGVIVSGLLWWVAHRAGLSQVTRAGRDT
ncbi:MAG: hypothetical protein Q4C87_03245 [Actinomycetaceae bacterium]|nr:hypothetical protein [Actinomycetaceae bacterium]